VGSEGEERRKMKKGAFSLLRYGCMYLVSWTFTILSPSPTFADFGGRLLCRIKRSSTS